MLTPSQQSQKLTLPYLEELKKNNSKYSNYFIMTETII